MLENWKNALQQGHAEEALKRYQQTDNSDAATREMLESLATMQTLLREKNVSKIKSLSFQNVPQWAKALVDDLTPQLATLAEAQKCLDRHQAEKVLELLNDVQHPLLLAEVETLRGTALIYDNDTFGAKAAFEKALSYDPKHYRAITNLGNLSLEANHLDQAISFYERALKLNEHFANAHHNLAVAYRKKGEVGKSVKALKQAQRVSQQNLRQEARGILRSPQTTKYLRWVFLALAALILFLFLRNRP
jgi:tetratricopeptide (TPR) repeat protein